MAWDDSKVDGTSTLTATEWNTHVTDQKTRQTAAQVTVLINTALTGRNFKIGNYAGNNTNNRAIPHGLDHTPTFIYVWVSTEQAVISGGYVHINATGRYAVTAEDATNFYVGADGGNYRGNATGTTYYWFAT